MLTKAPDVNLRQRLDLSRPWWPPWVWNTNGTSVHVLGVLITMWSRIQTRLHSFCFCSYRDLGWLPSVSKLGKLYVPQKFPLFNEISFLKYVEGHYSPFAGSLSLWLQESPFWKTVQKMSFLLFDIFRISIITPSETWLSFCFFFNIPVHFYF